MADPFVAEIRIFPFNFAPKGWAWCDGQILPIAQNEALFSLLGTTYGGDGISTFALPNLQGRAPIHSGPDPGPGLSLRVLGEIGGSESVTLLESEMPSHTHGRMASTLGATSRQPGDSAFAVGVGGVAAYAAPGATTTMSQQAHALQGSSQPHNNLQPYLTFYFNIALQGVFPPRQ